jgi:hypothetical protein
MKTTLVIEPEISIKIENSFWHSDKNVVQGSTATVLTNVDTLFVQAFGKSGTGKLSPLVGVEDNRFSQT